ncbi:hypothetical protein [Cohnella silvisoli]|uniref:Uncharacterized protein n=1 Tax=Cohnella silvisoli TaxID=2873699 RepID=A0ABV1KYT4_9BACL|nr:hypothetical protein [Cohnella silvisoli]MCD9024371.1 hypothetical protein [Cohnella silvisoli]
MNVNERVSDYATCSYVSDFTNIPPRMFLELAEMAEANGNDRMRRVWIANYLRVTGANV